MPTLLLEYTTKNVSEQSKVDKLHLWFDAKENQMREFRGGKLNFEWDFKEKRMKPKLRHEWNKDKKTYDVHIDEVFETRWRMTDNKETIQNWIKQIGSKMGVEINKEDSSNKGIAIDVDADNIAIVEYALDRQGIKYSEV